MTSSARSRRFGRSHRAKDVLRRAVTIEMLESRTLLSASGHSKPANVVPNGIPGAVPTLNTTPFPSDEITLDTTAPSLSDQADLENGADPTGSIQFIISGPGLTSSDTETVNGNGIYSSDTYDLPTTGTVAGTYSWDVEYGGDQYNSSVGDTTETTDVEKASPTISTTPNVTELTLGPANLPLQDSATLSDGYFPVGDITFKLYDPSNNVVDVETVGVNGNGTYSTFSGYMPTVAGTYQWDASYSGDDNNNSTDDNDDSTEQVSVSKASPTLDTTPNPTSLPLGPVSIPLGDSADLSGGSNPTGSITFTLYDPSNNKVDVETVSVFGNGLYSTFLGYTPTVAGTYQWDASYSGDNGNNSTSEDDSTNEQVTVTAATPELNTQADPPTTELNPGSTTLNDEAFLEGGDNPGGNITFTLYDPSKTLVDTEIVSVTGNGIYETSTGYSVPAGATGTYQWDASYSGDSANTTATDNDDPAEQVTVTAAPNTSSISGTAYTDITGDSFSNDDTPLSGVTIDLFGSDGTTLLSKTTTASDGTYSFGGLANGTYAVQEEIPAGYTQTGGNAGYTETFTGNGGSSTGDDFDNFPASSTISGKKYQDITGNGITSDDTPLSGVTIDLYENGGSTPVASTTTASNGSYSFTGLAAGTYKVKEVVPSGWTQTVGSSGYTVVVSGGSNTYSGKNFADFKNISISGTKFKDVTGNGFSTDDTHLGGVKIDLYKNGASTPYRTTTTASNGTYSFTNLGPGSYKVQEVVPSGYIQTGGGPSGSAGKTYYSVSAHSGKNSSGDNFDDYQIPTCKPKNVYFTINHGSKKYTTLTGHTHEGDTVTVTFTVPAGMDDVLTLVSYTSQSASFNNSKADEQKIYQVATGTFAPGTHSLTITIPNRYYQIDFICGPAINQLMPPNVGPDGANIIYGAEDRLLSTDI